MKKSNLIIVFLLSFILFASFAVLKQPSNKLINDEIFYYFQAQSIQENGTIPWLSNTQPPLYATLMGFVQLTGDWPLVGLRLLSALLMALAVAAFFYWATHYTNQKVAIVATVLFIFNVETFTLASQLYTEALFILLSILSLIFFDRYQTTQNEKDALLCWLLVGLSVLTRTTGLFLVLVLVYRFWKRNQKKWILGALIPILLLGIFLVMGATQLVVDKANEPWNYQQIYGGILVYGIPFLVLACFSFLTSGKKALFLKISVISYFILTLLLVRVVFYRYVWVTLPLVGLLVGLMLFEDEKKIKKVIIQTLIILTVIIQFLLIASYSISFSNNYFQIDGKDCQPINSWINSCTQQLTNLPDFGLDANQTCTYAQEIDFKEKYSNLILTYISDEVTVQIDQNIAVSKTNSVFSPLYIYPEIKGKKIVEITVHNYSNIGGIGQVLTCPNGMN